MDGMKNDYDQDKAEKVNNCGTGEIKLMKLRTWRYGGRHFPVPNGEIWRKTSMIGEPDFF